MFEMVAKELQLKFEKIRDFTSHAATIGIYREAAIRDTLKNYLSERFKVTTGFIYDYDTKSSSKQMDILIIDENYPAAYFLKEDDFIVASKDAVVCAIEIKSSFNASIFKDIVEKCHSAKSMRSSIAFFAFCFKSAVTEERIESIYSEAEFENTGANYPDLISLFNKGSLFLKPNDEKLGHRLLQPMLQNENIEKQTIALFVSLIMKSCFDRAGITENPVNHFKPGLVGTYKGIILSYETST